MVVEQLRTKQDTGKCETGKAVGEPTNQDLSPVQLRAIEYLAAGFKVTETAKKIRRGRSRIYEWYAQESFQNGLRRRQEELAQEVREELEVPALLCAKRALQVLLYEMNDPHPRLGPVRVSACRAALAFAGKMFISPLQGRGASAPRPIVIVSPAGSMPPPS